MRAQYDIWIANHLGVRRSLGKALLIDYWLVANGIGTITLQVRRDALPLSFYTLDARIEVWRNGRLEGAWLLRYVSKRISARGEKVVELRGVGLLDLLVRRIVAYAAGSAQAAKAGASDDVMKAIVRENLGGSAGVERDLSAYLEVEADGAAGPAIEKRFSRRNVLRVLQEIAQQTAELGTPVLFDVVYAPSGEAGEYGRYVFRTYLYCRGYDHRYASGNQAVVLSADFGTLGEVERYSDYSAEITVMYAAGQGLEADRTVVSAEDAARTAASPLNRREGYLDARHISLESSLAAEAEAGLHEGQPLAGLRGTIVSTPQAEYGQHWGFGDLVSGAVDGAPTDCRVDRVHVVVRGRQETITAELHSAGSAVAYTAEERLAWAIERTAVGELPRVTQTPVGYGTPQAGTAGTIADGWLSSAIARLSDVAAEATARAAADSAEAGTRAAADTAEATARAAADAAHAALTTSAHGGIVASSDPRLSDARTPTAHASSHKHGGSDEIATATPGANAIPKAGSGGTIADGWLSAAIARLTDLTWANIAGKPSTFTPSAHASSHKHGGSDEIATATPGANAIPKAGSGGTLADAWLSSAIARIASAATAGRVAFYSDGQTIAHDGAFVWDNTNKWLGIGVTPTVALDVAGSARIVGTYLLLQSDQATAYAKFYSTYNGSNPIQLTWTKSRNGAACSAGDVIGDLAYNFFNSGNSEVQAALLRCVAETVTAGSEASRFQFYVATAGSLGEAMRLTSNKALLVGRTSGLTGAGDVDANGTVRGATFQVGANQVVGARKTGWALPTGTLSRATFDQSTVTLAGLAQRVAALITDLYNQHGLIGA